MAVPAQVVELEDLKIFMGIGAGTARDRKLDLLIAGVNRTLASVTGRDLQSATRTAERHAGSGTRTMVLLHYPITSVTTIDEDGTAIDPTDRDVVEILEEQGTLIKVDGVWQHTINQIYTIEYVAGPELSELEDLKMAAYEMCNWVHKTGGVAFEEGFSSRSTSLFGRAMLELPGVRDILESYSDTSRGFHGSVIG